MLHSCAAGASSGAPKLRLPEIGKGVRKHHHLKSTLNNVSVCFPDRPLAACGKDGNVALAPAEFLAAEEAVEVATQGCLPRGDTAQWHRCRSSDSGLNSFLVGFEIKIVAMKPQGAEQTALEACSKGACKQQARIT